MGIKHLPSYKDSWSSRYDIPDHFIASVISRNRFSWLLGNVYLNNNLVQPKQGENAYDKLYKLRPLLDSLSETYAKSYKPSQCQAIDESIIRFKGRISFRQHMPIKPIKRGCGSEQMNLVLSPSLYINESGFVSQHIQVMNY